MPLRILVVDDSPAMCSAIQRMVELSGLPVETFLTAENGKVALSILKIHNVNLMLVDLNMPVMDGAEFIRCLHRDSGQRCVPFIAMSADATAVSVQTMLDLGAIAYISKPFRAEALRLEMKKALESELVAEQVDV